MLRFSVHERIVLAIVVTVASAVFIVGLAWLFSRKNRRHRLKTRYKKHVLPLYADEKLEDDGSRTAAGSVLKLVKYTSVRHLDSRRIWKKSRRADDKAERVTTVA